MGGGKKMGPIDCLDGGGNLCVGLPADQGHVGKRLVGEDPVEHRHHVVLHVRARSALGRAFRVVDEFDV